MKNKIQILIQEYKGTTILEGSTTKYLIFFWLTKFFSFIQQSNSLLNKAIHQIVKFLPKIVFIIQNKSGVFVVQAFDDSTTICSNYFESELRGWLLKPSARDIFIDIGANRGIYTIIAPTRFEYKEVHAFEPNPIVFEVLNKNIQLNNLKKISVAHNYALGNSNETLSFECDVMHLGGGRIVPESTNNTTAVSVKVFDDMLPAVDSSRISFIKIDTEGFEFNVLEGMKKTLSNMPLDSYLMIESTELDRLKSFLSLYSFGITDSNKHDHLFKKHA